MTPTESTNSGAPFSMSQRFALGLCVALSGGAVMLYEFLTVRVMQRFYGGALETWASCIAVCLVAMSAGYALGGYLAERCGTWTPLGAAMFLSGLSGLFIEKITVALGNYFLEQRWSIDWEPYVVSLLASSLPILCAATVQPQAIRIRARGSGQVGMSAGWVAALSTLGSVAGVLLYARVLMRYVGFHASLIGISAALMVCGALFLAPAVRRKLFAAALLLAALPSGAAIVFEGYTAYHHVIVEDTSTTRMLRFNNDVQSLMPLRDPFGAGFEYTEFFHAPLVLDPTINHVLFIGLGGGTGPKQFLRLYPGMKVDVVEIDADIVRIARQYFSLPEHPRLRVVTMDGRAYLQRTPTQYGAIIMDAYGSGPAGAYLPYHMATREFFGIVSSRLVNGGCLVYNVMGAYGGANDNIVRGMMNTLEQVFHAVYAFQARSSINTVFLAQKIDPGKLQANGTRDGTPWPQGPWLAHPLSPDNLGSLAATVMQQGLINIKRFDRRIMQTSRVQFAPRVNVVFTDDLAPVE